MKTLIRADSRRSDGRASQAFTLVDLLGALVAVALLSLAALPVIAANKGKSKVMQCLDNVRAINLGTTLFTEENRYYPPLWRQPGNPAWPTWTYDSTTFVVQNGAALYWPDTLRLEGYVKDPTVFSCPNLTVSSAGGGGSSKSALGIGMNYPSLGKTIVASDLSSLPPKPSDVKQPSLTVVYGDSSPATIGSFSVAKPDGWVEDSAYEAAFGSVTYFRTPADMSFQTGDAVLMPRHDHRVVTGWADGHVELFKNSRMGWQYPPGNTNALWDL